ncbi:MAG: DUF1214 domain-containing protein [Steroidobacteraceae bacterium]
MMRALLVVVALVMLASCSTEPPEPQAVARPYSDQDISDAYIYLLSRLLVLRQQQLDFQQGFRWNEFVHRMPGAVAWPNPNLDVAYSEAWVAVDESSCTIVDVPKVRDRYYTVHFLNGWGETVANINERMMPERPDGKFAMCLKDAQVELPAGVQRLDLPVKYTRVLARVQLGADRDGAVRLQHGFKLKTTGTPALPALPQTPMFEMESLPGVEAFEAAPAVLDSEADINQGMETLQSKTRAIAEGVKDPAERTRVDGVVREKALSDFRKALPTVGHGTVQNGWVLPRTSGAYGDDWLTRTLVNYGGIWANIPEEVIYYKGLSDAAGEPLSGDHAYTMTFTKEQLPANFATYFWSVIAVDAVHKRVLPNPKERYLLNAETHPKYGADGSLVLYFADQKPAAAPVGNWLPTPKGAAYNLTFRFYRPKGLVAERSYFPPLLVRTD